MIAALIYLAVLTLLFCMFWFSKTSKEVPKSWYEWKMEFRYQYLGIAGLIEDFTYRSKDKVGMFKF